MTGDMTGDGNSGCRLDGKVVLVTGAASGIGRAMAIRFAAEGAKKIVCADLNLAGAEETANQINGLAVAVNVGVEAEIAALIDRVETEIGPIDLFCSNAGISVAGGVERLDPVPAQNLEGPMSPLGSRLDANPRQHEDGSRGAREAQGQAPAPLEAGALGSLIDRSPNGRIQGSRGGDGLQALENAPDAPLALDGPRDAGIQACRGSELLEPAEGLQHAPVHPLRPRAGRAHLEVGQPVGRTPLPRQGRESGLAPGGAGLGGRGVLGAGDHGVSPCSEGRDGRRVPGQVPHVHGRDEI